MEYIDIEKKTFGLNRGIRLNQIDKKDPILTMNSIVNHRL